MNNNKDIEIGELIEKYFEGLTTLAEEQLLRDYFRKEAIPENRKQYQPIFQYFAMERANAQAETVQPLHTGKSWKRNIRRFSVAAAACLLLFFGLKLTFNRHRTLPGTSWAYVDGKKYTDINLIRMETLKALENLSEENEEVYSSQIEALDFFLDNNETFSDND
ncbi:MAG: hypothetical protein LBT25_03915 [Candidatus Symbiothrix sp.]|jgi:hypothetical protein|nr:hypothetical protein [Candidatus Symbiothrix sp.]